MYGQAVIFNMYRIILSLFAEADINLTRIASMPLRSDPGNYCFFLDFEGTDQDENVIEILEKMKDLTIFLKFLGCYPAYREKS